MATESCRALGLAEPVVLIAVLPLVVAVVAGGGTAGGVVPTRRAIRVLRLLVGPLGPLFLKPATFVTQHGDLHGELRDLSLERVPFGPPRGRLDGGTVQITPEPDDLLRVYAVVGDGRRPSLQLLDLDGK